MRKIEIVSLDIFQTLVDVDKRIPIIWQGILGSDYSPEKAEPAIRAVSACLGDALRTATHNETFMPIRDMFILCAKNAAKISGLSLDAEKIAYHVMLQHAYAPFYDEVAACLNALEKKYRIILCSDSNHLMVDKLLPHIRHERLFISEDLRCYKGDPRHRFFDAVLRDLRVPGERVLHIGDGASDVLGARGSGIISCWLNRHKREWTHAENPDYIINDLNGLSDIL